MHTGAVQLTQQPSQPPARATTTRFGGAALKIPMSRPGSTRPLASHCMAGQGSTHHCLLDVLACTLSVHKPAHAQVGQRQQTHQLHREAQDLQSSSSSRGTGQWEGPSGLAAAPGLMAGGFRGLVRVRVRNSCERRADARHALAAVRRTHAPERAPAVQLAALLAACGPVTHHVQGGQVNEPLGSEEGKEGCCNVADHNRLVLSLLKLQEQAAGSASSRESTASRVRLSLPGVFVCQLLEHSWLCCQANFQGWLSGHVQGYSLLQTMLAWRHCAAACAYLLGHLVEVGIKVLCRHTRATRGNVMCVSRRVLVLADSTSVTGPCCCAQASSNSPSVGREYVNAVCCSSIPTSASALATTVRAAQAGEQGGLGGLGVRCAPDRA